MLFYEDVPTGTRVTSVVAGQGACTPPAEANFGAVGCRLGALDVGASTTVIVKFKVTARAGTIVHNWTPETSVMVSGAVLTSEAREPTGAARQNHVVKLDTRVKAKPKPKPKKKKKQPRR